MVETWRNTKAIVWMQSYFVKGNDRYVALNDDRRAGYKYCLRLGVFSIEL